MTSRQCRRRVFAFTIAALATACLEDGGAVAPGAIAGQVIGFDGVPVAGALIRLEVLDGQGGAAWSGIATFADAAGAFDLDVEPSVASGTVLTAYLGDATVRGFALADGQRVVIHPVTESLVRVILAITSAGEPGWNDLGARDLRLLHDRVVDSVPVAMELSDSDGLDGWVRNAVGDLLAERFHGVINARRASAVLGVNQASVGPDFSSLDPPPPGSPCNRRNWVLEGATFSFDIIDTGALCDGNDGNLFDAFDRAFFLRVRDDNFAGGDPRFPTQTATTLEDERELVLGPEPLESGLEITRKLYVTADDDVARYLEIVHNPTIEIATITLEIVGALGAEADTILLLAETGAAVTVGDHYAATGQVFPLEPTIGFLWDGHGIDAADRLYFPPDSFGGFQYAWEDIELAPGETKVYAHFVLLTSWRDQVAMAARLAALLEAPPLEGLSAHEAENLQNFHTSSIANVVGGAGATAPGLLVSVANLATGAEQATVAGLDGSFAVLISDASTGQELLVRSLTGGERSVTIH